MKINSRLKFKLGMVGACLQLAGWVAYASPSSAPVLDFSTQYQASAAQQEEEGQPHQQTSVKQVLETVRHRLDNYDQQHLFERLETLQHQVETLQGQLEVQSHTLVQLHQQQTQLYEALNKRLAALSMTAASSSHASPAQRQQYQQRVESKDSTVDYQMTRGDFQSYHAAFELLQKKQYTAAIDALKQFKTRYPNSQYAPNAHYWLGQIYQLQGHLKEAMGWYTAVVKHYPNSAKVADALYKMAMIARKQGQLTQSKHYLQTIINQFPNQAIASLAKTELERLSNQPDRAIKT